MDTIPKLHAQPLHLSLNPSRLFFPKPIISSGISSPPLKFSSTTTRACSSSSSSKTLIAPIVKTACVTVTAVAALFLSGIALKPATAIVAPADPTTEQERLAGEEEEEEEEGEEAVDPEKERAIEERVARDPKDADSLRELMEVRLKSGKLPEAIEALDRLIQLEPEDMEWKLLKAQIYSFSGEFESARRCFEGVLEKDPFRVEAYHGLLMADAESGTPYNDVSKRIKAAMDRCRKENKSSDLRDFKLLVAQVSVMEEKYGDALRLYEELVTEEPKDFRPYLCQGIIYTLMRKKDEAEKKFEQFRKLVPRNHPFRDYFYDNMFATKFLAEKVEREAASSRS